MHATCYRKEVVGEGRGEGTDQISSNGCESSQCLGQVYLRKMYIWASQEWGQHKLWKLPRSQPRISVPGRAEWGRWSSACLPTGLRGSLGLCHMWQVARKSQGTAHAGPSTCYRNCSWLYVAQVIPYVSACCSRDRLKYRSNYLQVLHRQRNSKR